MAAALGVSAKVELPVELPVELAVGEAVAGAAVVVGAVVGEAVVGEAVVGEAMGATSNSEAQGPVALGAACGQCNVASELTARPRCSTRQVMLCLSGPPVLATTVAAQFS